MRIRVRTLAVVCAAVLLILSAAVGTALAQDIVGRISGTVADQNGGVIAGATVTVTNEATGDSRPADTTDSSGLFVFDALPVGSYSLAVEAKGMEKMVVKGVVVTAGGRTDVPVTMAIGSVSTVVQVQAVSNQTNTISGEIASTITPSQVQNAPLNQRHYETLVGLIPGAALQSSGESPASFTSGYNNSAAVFNGQHLDEQNWSVDGGWNLDSGSNNSVFNEVGVDFIQEVDVQTSNYDAEFGRAGSATINVVTKSGGDQYHGGAFEFIQNNDFNAGTAATKLAYNAHLNTTCPTLSTGHCLVPAFHLNDYGWNLGGPIPYIQPKGKLFIFAGQEWKHFRGSAAGLGSASQTETFPTLAEVGGNFADVLPTCVGAGCNGILMKVPNVAPLGCVVTAGVIGNDATNQLSAGCLTQPDGQAIAKIYTDAAKISTNGALPNPGVAAVCCAPGSNMLFNLGNPANIREDIIRADEHANDKQSFYFRYLHDYVDIVNPFSTFGTAGEVPILPDARFRPGTNYQIGWTDVINPSLVNEAKFNADWHSQHTPPGSAPIAGLSGPSWMRSTYGFQFTPPLGLPAETPPQFGAGVPEINFGGISGAATSGPTFVASPAVNFLESPTADINPMDNVTWQKNNHTIKFGVLYAHNRKTQNARVAYSGNITFANNAGNPSSTNSTGDPFADALLGNFSSIQQNSAIAIGAFRFNDLEDYIEDTWKVTHNLSVVMGLRHYYEAPLYALGNNITNFNPAVFSTAYPGPVFTSVGSTNLLNILPQPFMCSGPLINLPGNPVISNECNGEQLPGFVPTSQQGRVPASIDTQLLGEYNHGAASGLYQPKNLFGPRFGFSFAPFNDKTVIRGGFGIFYDQPEGNALCGSGFGCQGYTPWTVSTTVNTSGVSNETLSNLDPGGGGVAVSAPAPTTLGQNGTFPGDKYATTYQYSLSVQRELPQNLLLQIGYVGDQGRHILRQPSVNTPSPEQNQAFIPNGPNPNTYSCAGVTAGGLTSAAYSCGLAVGGSAAVPGYAPQPAMGKTFAGVVSCPTCSGPNSDQIREFLGYTGFNEQMTDGDSNYNSLQMALTKRAGFLTSTLAYTYSKAMGTDAYGGSSYNDNVASDCSFACLTNTAANPVIITGGTPPLNNTGNNCSNNNFGITCGYAGGYGGVQSGGVVVPWKKYLYSKEGYDATNIWAASFTIDSPWGKGMTGLEGAAVKGWSVSGVVHWQSGSPLTATGSVLNGNTNTTITRRAMLVPGTPLGYASFGPASSCPDVGSDGRVHAVCWVNPNAFTLGSTTSGTVIDPLTLAEGTAPIGDIIGPSYYQWDLSLRKTTALPWREGMSITLQMDAFNALNQTNWNNPGTGVATGANNSGFGWITGSLPARVMQFGGKFVF